MYRKRAYDKWWWHIWDAMTDKEPVKPAEPRAEVRPLIREASHQTQKPQAKFSPIFRQVLAASGPVMATVCSGMTTGYSAVLLPQLKAENSTIHITEEEASWIASAAPLLMALGCALSGFLLERCGRRLAQLLICAPFAAGWILLAAAQGLGTILAGRFLTGLCVGLVGPPTIIYIGETAGPAHRGVLLAAVSLAVSVGILIAHLLGSILSWRATAGACAACPLTCWALLCLAPESPVWLAARGRSEDAANAFRWLRGFDEAATAELDIMLAKHANAALAKSNDNGSSDDIVIANPTEKSLLKKLLSRSFIQPFIILNVFFFVMQFSGVNAVAFYTVTILKDVAGSVDEYKSTIIIDVVRVLASAVACVLLRRVGRRPLAVWSTAGAAVTLLTLGGMLTWGEKESATTSWIVISLLIAYMTSISMGLVPLPWVLSGELFPGALRGIGGGASSCIGFMFFFAVVKTGPILFSTVTPGGAFAIYGAIAAFGTLFLMIFLPETRNQTLQQIEDKFSKKKKIKKHPDNMDVV